MLLFPYLLTIFNVIVAFAIPALANRKIFLTQTQFHQEYFQQRTDCP